MEVFGTSDDGYGSSSAQYVTDPACNLVRGPGQIDLDAVALQPHADLDGKAHVAVPAVVVEEALGTVLAVGDLGDALAQHPLGVVHELAGRGQHGVHPVAGQQLVEATHSEPA